jgi:(p)ppGpp synthase/HD superfamily hydrolase
MADPAIQGLLKALAFAAARHRDQRRKGAGAPPFINHSIEVAEIIARVAGVTDPITLQAAVLHDTLEDTETRADEIEAEFGPEVAAVVLEVTDDRRLSREERRRRQEADAAGLSTAAKLIRVADKVANVRAIAHAPPVDWSTERRLDYVRWSQRVVTGCRGCSPDLEAYYDDAAREAAAVLEAGTGA